MPDFLGKRFGADFPAETVSQREKQSLMLSVRLIVMLFFAGQTLLTAGNLEWLDSLGGRMDKNPAGEVTDVHLRGTWVTDAELLDLTALRKLERLDLSHTRITDEGLLHLK